MVDKSEHFEFNFTFYKNLYEDQWNELTSDNKESMAAIEDQNAIGDQCTYVQGVLLSVDHENDRVKLKTAISDSEYLEYNILVIATGASYGSPWKA
jgi:NADH dehydrogenase FAD-containing subunit